ncbi:MAG: radical SAM protein [Candidatus Nitronauta litoralis]|uniref:Radical SAM protein n=1 Tax=Candidatus Nitronauta litoralis TaxID=2705533 RepID=A0A7T0BVX5_9BACT|nr:MAG: radical SAM protein [Candidatus Nitronauta litoralis]
MTDSRFLISSDQFEPAYMELFRSGELYRRSRQGLRHLEKCRVCPRDCDVNRLSNEWALCKTGRYAWVSSYFPHFGEEGCLKGANGSGTIFFSMCNLKCVFCQNYDISQQQDGMEATPEVLANMMMELQTKGCHNINFVTPEHVVPQILEALPMAVQMGLRLPLVYNTGAFDSMESLKLMEGVVDIYMPDFKYWTAEDSAKYLKATRYPQVAREVVREMHRQVGPLTFDENGLAKRGVLVRHLVMPDSLENTKSIMQFLSDELSPDTYVNVMDQYRPAGKVTPERFPTLARRTTNEEHDQAVEITREAGLTRIDHCSAQGQ